MINVLLPYILSPLNCASRKKVKSTRLYSLDYSETTTDIINAFGALLEGVNRIKQKWFRTNTYGKKKRKNNIGITWPKT
jgi:hypothetical protein